MSNTQFVKVYYTLLENFNIKVALKIALIKTFDFAEWEFFRKWFSRRSFYMYRNMRTIIENEDERFIMITISDDFDVMMQELVKKANSAKVSYYYKKKYASEELVTKKRKRRNRQIKKETIQTKTTKTKKTAFWTKDEIEKLRKTSVNWRIYANFIKKHTNDKKNINVDVICDTITRLEKQAKEKNIENSVGYVIAALRNGAHWQDINRAQEQKINMQKQEQKQEQEQEIVDNFPSMREVGEWAEKYKKRTFMWTEGHTCPIMSAWDYAMLGGEYLEWQKTHNKNTEKEVEVW